MTIKTCPRDESMWQSFLSWSVDACMMQENPREPPKLDAKIERNTHAFTERNGQTENGQRSMNRACRTRTYPCIYLDLSTCAGPSMNRSNVPPLLATRACRNHHQSPCIAVQLGGLFLEISVESHFPPAKASSWRSSPLPTLSFSMLSRYNVGFVGGDDIDLSSQDKVGSQSDLAVLLGLFLTFISTFS